MCCFSALFLQLWTTCPFPPVLNLLTLVTPILIPVIYSTGQYVEILKFSCVLSTDCSISSMLVLEEEWKEFLLFHISLGWWGSRDAIIYTWPIWISESLLPGNTHPALGWWAEGGSSFLRILSFPGILCLSILCHGTPKGGACPQLEIFGDTLKKMAIACVLPFREPCGIVSECLTRAREVKVQIPTLPWCSLLDLGSDSRSHLWAFLSSLEKCKTIMK